jgi:hypothetical protein
MPLQLAIPPQDRPGGTVLVNRETIKRPAGRSMLIR